VQVTEGHFVYALGRDVEFTKTMFFEKFDEMRIFFVDGIAQRIEI
jgi:hypothetical protein